MHARRPSQETNELLPTLHSPTAAQAARAEGRVTPPSVSSTQQSAELGCHHFCRAWRHAPRYSIRVAELARRMMRSWVMQLVCATAAVQLPARVTLPCGCPMCAATQLSTQILESSDESQGSRNPSEAAVSALKFYKKVISPLIPPGCRFIPTCSECMRAQVFEPCLPAPTRMRCVIHAVLT